MKKLMCFLFALGFLFVACQRTETDVPDNLELTQVTASFAPETKTVLVDNTKVWWAPGDVIFLASSEGSAPFVADNEEPAAQASFQGSLPVNPNNSRLFAIYPFQDRTEFEDGYFTTYLSSWQDGIQGSFADNTLVMMSRSDNRNLSFYHVCGGLCFSVTQSGVTSVKLTGGNEEALAGMFTAGFDDNGKPEILQVVEPEFEAVLTCPDGLVPGQKYFIVLLPTPLENGISLRFEKGTDSYAIRTIDKSVSIKRGIFARLLNADEGLTYEDYKDPVLTCDSMQGIDCIKAYFFSYYPLQFPSGGINKKDGVDYDNVSSEKANRSSSLQVSRATVSLDFTLIDCSEDISTLSQDAFSIQEEGADTMVPSLQSISFQGGNKFSVTIALGTNGASSGTIRLALNLPSGKVVISDPIRLEKAEQVLNVRLASKVANANYNYHYRRAEVGIGNIDSEVSKAAADGYTNLGTKAVNDLSASFEGTMSSCDELLPYNQTLDLMQLVCVHMEDGSASHHPLSNADLDRLGLKWMFEVVKGYQTGTTPVFQENFITLSTTSPVIPGTPVVATPRAYGNANTRAAMGKTPVIRVSLMDGNKMVECAYIKLCIGDDPSGDSSPQDSPAVVERSLNFEFTGNFNCSPDSLTFQLTTKQMFDAIYVPAERPPFEFHQKYSFNPNYHPEYGSPIPPAGQYGRVYEISSDQESTGSAVVLRWKLGMNDIWDIATAEPYTGIASRTVYYSYGDDIFSITFKARVAQFSIKWDFVTQGKGQYNPSYWYDDNGHIDNVNFGHTRFTVSLPRSGETNPDYCLFENDLNAPFKTDENGKIIVTSSDNMPFSDFEYFFCKDNNNLSIAGIQLKVKDNDPLTLYGVKGGTEEVVATIQNTVYQAHDYLKTEIQNVIILNKASDFAKTMLNAGYDALKVYIGAKANICGVAVAGTAPAVTPKQIIIYFNGKDHFQARFIRPITVSYLEDDEYFVDGVDYGEEHSYIPVSKLLWPLDWRGRKFGDRNSDSGLWYYWQYYGLDGITIIPDAVRSNYYHLSTMNGVDPLPSGAKVFLSHDIYGSQQSSYGSFDDYLIYRNTVNSSMGYCLFMRLIVDYAWGSTVTDEMKIEVKPLSD